jgi:chemotaxis signal transduction protein
LSNSIQLTVFSAAQEVFALPLLSVVEVVRPGTPLKLPHAPFGCVGALDVRGQTLPLLSLGTILGLEPPVDASALQERLEKSHGLIVDAGGLHVALLTDRVLDVTGDVAVTLEGLEQAKAAFGRAASVITGIARWHDRHALVIDPSGLLSRGRRRLIARIETAPLGGGGT